jgi:hypothetical protein
MLQRRMHSALCSGHWLERCSVLSRSLVAVIRREQQAEYEQHRDFDTFQSNRLPGAG